MMISSLRPITTPLLRLSRRPSFPVLLKECGRMIHCTPINLETEQTPGTESIPGTEHHTPKRTKQQFDGIVVSDKVGSIHFF